MKLTLHPRALLVLATLLSTVGYTWNFQYPILAATPPLTIANPTDLTVPVIQHPSSQEFPDIDGQHVVWQDFRFGPTDIFMADLQTHVITNLTETDTWEVQPDIDGDLVVWKDGYQGIGIHGLNIATGQRFTVTEGHPDTSRPHLSGNIVVWADNRAGENDWNIYGYDLAKNTEFVIADGPGNQVDPQIDGNFVVWWDHQFRIYLYQVDTKQTKTIVDAYSAQLPDVSAADHLIVWQDFRNGDSDVYGYDLTTHTEKPVVIEPDDQVNVVIANGLVAYQSQILGVSWNIQLHVLADNTTFGLVDNSNAQTQPAVSGNGVVWQDLRNHQSDIYQFTWTGIIPPLPTHAVAAPGNLQVGAFPAHRIYLQWQDNALDETGYKVERAQGITGTTWSEIASLRANTTVYTDTPTLLGESYWYRVRAYNVQGDSAYSNESFNSTIDSVPNPNELYLMVLINEARAAPAVFGYSAYPPVPPLAYNPLVAYSAHSHSQSILNSVFQFGHCDPIGRCPTEQVRAVNYVNPSGCSENLTTGNSGYKEMEAANQSFLDSTGHRDNMLNIDAKEFGIGHTFDVNKGEYWRHGQFTEVFCNQANFTIPSLPTGAITPYTGTITTPFTYAVNFYSNEGLPPTKAQVVIDDTLHDLKLSTGAAANGTYRYTTILPVGKHNYHFVFQYGQNVTARWPETGAVDYPDVYDPDNPWTPTPTPTATPTATQTATPTSTPSVTLTPLATPVGQGDKLKLHLPLVKR